MPSMDQLKALAKYLPIVIMMSVAGCGGEERVSVYPVQGSVTVSGKPASGVALQFHPKSNQHQIFPRTVTAEDGSFRMTTYKRNDGIPAGDYVVTASWRQVDTSEEMETHPDELSLADELLDETVTDPATTPLRVTVTDGPNVLPPFEITEAEANTGKKKRKRKRSL